MFTKVSSSSRHHRRVIHEDGSPAETVRFRRLSFVLGGAPADVETTLPLPAVAGPTRVLPVHGHAAIALRVPERVRVSPADWVRFGFARAARELNGFVEVVSSGWRKAAAENDAAIRALDERLERLAGRVQAWTMQSCDADLLAAHAEGGTELVLALTPEVLARLDAAKALAGSAVSA